MYERFSDRAREVIQFAHEEAKRLQHEYIGTEHILLGMLKVESGLATLVFKHFDVDFERIRTEVEKIVPAGTGMFTVGKLPHTPRAKTVIISAIEEARKLGHRNVGTEHLLIGLLRQEQGVAAQVFMNLNLSRDEVREKLLTLKDYDREVSDPAPKPSAEHPRAVLRLANGEAQRLNHLYVGTEHIVLAIALNETCLSARVLQGYEIGLCQLRNEVERIHPANSTIASTWQLPHPPETRTAIENALKEARSLDHAYVGTEHFLLSLLSDENCVAAQVLTNFNIDLNNLRKEILELLGQ